MEVNMKVEGLDKAIDAMKRMETAVSRKLVNSAIRKATKPILSEMKANAPNADNDSLINNIGIRAKRKGSKWMGYRVGVVSNKGKVMKNFTPQALAAVMEYGTAVRTKRGGASTGAVRKRPFLRPAMDKHESSVRRNVEQEIVNAVNKALK